MIVSDIIKEFSPHLFWDVDRSQLDIDKSREQIICQVLEFGLMNDWEFLKRIYTKEKIKEVVLNLRTMDKVNLSSLLRIILNWINPASDVTQKVS
jgi:hypothetical protein